MNELICPVCNLKLNFCDRVYRCENNHCFDMSKYGVVNLMMSNKSSKKRHGDDKLMVLSRKNFLDKGYYEPICSAVTALAQKHGKKEAVLVDAGCGEGYYTKSVADKISAKSIYGIDVSKEALRYFKKRCNNSTAAVASLFKMPIKNESADILLNMFAPAAEKEFARILKRDGILIRTTVLKNHLLELKQSVYDNAYANSEEALELDGFTLVDKEITDYRIKIDNNDDIKSLFCMTPYYYKTSVNDQQKLDTINSLETEIEVVSLVYKIKE